MLSHDESEKLHRIEQWFETADPALVAAFRKPPRKSRRTALMYTLDVLAVLLLALSIVASSSAIVLGSLACVVAAVGLHVDRFLEKDSR